MRPLRLDRVKVKFERLLETFGGQVHVSIPVSRRNVAEVAETREWFAARGAQVFLVPLMSRCAEDRTLFERISFAPGPMRCDASILDDLAIDCDGLVLGCCQDFQRAEPIGDLRTETLAAFLTGRRRAERAQLLEAGAHQDMATCSRCFSDFPGSHEAALAG